MKTIKSIYFQTLIIQYILFIVLAILLRFLFNGSYEVNKVFILLLIGGIIYLPAIALINLTQFLCVKDGYVQNEYSVRGFFIPPVLIGIGAFYTLDIFWFAAFTGQFIASVVGFIKLKSKV